MADKRYQFRKEQDFKVWLKLWGVSANSRLHQLDRAVRDDPLFPEEPNREEALAYLTEQGANAEAMRLLNIAFDLYEEQKAS